MSDEKYSTEQIDAQASVVTDVLLAAIIGFEQQGYPASELVFGVWNQLTDYLKESNWTPDELCALINDQP